jgi:CRISPR system Cascade subunit CasC
VDRVLLVRNLGGDAEAQALAATALGALAEAAATAAPSGKQNSFAAHGRAQYILAERGDAQPRTLAGAFSKAVTGSDLVEDSVAALLTFRAALDDAYGPAATDHEVMHVGKEGSLAEIVAFARG